MGPVEDFRLLVIDIGSIEGRYRVSLGHRDIRGTQTQGSVVGRPIWFPGSFDSRDSGRILYTQSNGLFRECWEGLFFQIESISRDMSLFNIIVKILV